MTSDNPAGASKPDAVTVYSAPMIIPVTAPVITNGAVAVHDGKVIHFGARKWVLASVRSEFPDHMITERHWDGLMTPGLINAHTHLQYTCMEHIGRGTYDRFRAWELAFNQAYAQLSDSPGIWSRSARQGARRLVQAGTTAAADVVTDIEAVDALTSQGLHGIAYWEIMGWSNEEWDDRGRDSLLKRLKKIGNMGVQALGISPHAPYTLESKPFLDIPDIARRRGLRMHIHLGETALEQGLRPSELTTYTGVGWQHADWRSYRELKLQGLGASSIQFVDQLGALGPDVHIAHGVYADKEDRRLLRQRGVCVALCPRSNRVTNTMRDADVAGYLNEGNLVSIGTDSLSSSPSLDVLDDCSLLYDLAREQGYRKPDLSHRLIRMVTLGGAEALGLNVGWQRIGQINSGALADLAFFDLPVDIATPDGIETTLERFVRAGAGTNRVTVIAGTIAYDKGGFHD